MKFKYWLSIALSSLFLIGCDMLAGGGVEGTGNGDSGFIMDAFAQKGPFLVGSNVVAQPLKANATNNGGSINTKVGNQLGDFTVNLESDGPVFLQVTGRTFNEITAQPTDEMTLNAALNITKRQETYFVNLLTQLISDRVIFLMKEGQSIDLAIVQAEQELKSEIDRVMGISSEFVSTQFSEMSLYNYSGTVEDSNAYLLLVSAAIYQTAFDIAGGNTNQLDQVLENLILSLTVDLEQDGDWDLDEASGNQLKSGAENVDIEAVKQNLESLSTGAGVNVLTPSLDTYLNSVYISSVANESTVNGSTTILVSAPSGVGTQNYNLLVNGELVDSQNTDEYSYNWQPYFWSQTSKSRLIVEVESASGQQIGSEPVDVNIDASVNAILIAQSGHNETIQNAEEIVLSWQPVEGAVSYCLRLNGIEQCGLTETSYTTKESDNLSLGQNNWQINATNALGKTGIWSETFSFTIQAPSTPQNLNAEVGERNAVTFTWDAVEGASGYELRYYQVLLNTGYESPYDEWIDLNYTDSVELDSNNITLALPKGIYLWTVQAENALGHRSEWVSSQELSQGLFYWIFKSQKPGEPKKELSIYDYFIGDNEVYILAKEEAGSNTNYFVAAIDWKGAILWRTPLPDGLNHIFLPEFSLLNENLYIKLITYDENRCKFDQVIKINDEYSEQIFMESLNWDEENNVCDYSDDIDITLSGDSYYYYEHQKELVIDSSNEIALTAVNLENGDSSVYALEVPKFEGDFDTTEQQRLKVDEILVDKNGDIYLVLLDTSRWKASEDYWSELGDYSFYFYEKHVSGYEYYSSIFDEIYYNEEYYYEPPSFKVVNSKLHVSVDYYSYRGLTIYNKELLFPDIEDFEGYEYIHLIEGVNGYGILRIDNGYNDDDAYIRMYNGNYFDSYVSGFLGTEYYGNYKSNDLSDMFIGLSGFTNQNNQYYPAMINYTPEGQHLKDVSKEINLAVTD